MGKSKKKKATPAGPVYTATYAYGEGSGMAPEPMSIDDQPPSGDTSTLALGVHVKVDGLASRPELNGRVGTIVTSVQGSGRYGVSIGGEVVALKPERLERMAADRW